eukprot:GGOE01003325.1.p1 GENE.GGOE01003325.1~~GGOE01003325.1.p1  ORF type:complete len:191 (+),score=72.13 GGOE01003325.1:69-575(+)
MAANEPATLALKTKLFDRLDADKSGMLDPAETANFLKALTTQQMLLKVERVTAEATTSYPDVAKEVAQAFAEAARKVEKFASTLDFAKDGEAAVVTMDRNADGLISREEFFLTADRVTTKVQGPAVQALQEFSRRAVAEAMALVKEIMLDDALAKVSSIPEDPDEEEL